MIGCSAWDDHFIDTMGTDFIVICDHLEEFFNAQPIRMEVFDVVAPANDWMYSTFIKFDIASRTRTLLSLSNVQDHTEALPIMATPKQIAGYKKSLLVSTQYARLQDGSMPTIACATYAMSLIMKFITGDSVIDEIENRFPPANHICVSFALLYSIPLIHQQLDYQVINFHRSDSTNNLAMLDLFRYRTVGVHWVDAQLITHRLLKANHALVLHILRKFDSSDHPDDVVASLQDNREEIGLVQAKDIKEAIKSNSGLHIFQLFLGEVPVTLANIVLFKRRSSDSNTLVRAREVNSLLQNRPHTRNLLASIDAIHASCSASASTSVSNSKVCKRKAQKRAKERARRRSASSKRMQPLTMRRKKTPFLVTRSPNAPAFKYGRLNP